MAQEIESEAIFLITPQTDPAYHGLQASQILEKRLYLKDESTHSNPSLTIISRYWIWKLMVQNSRSKTHIIVGEDKIYLMESDLPTGQAEVRIQSHTRRTALSIRRTRRFLIAIKKTGSFENIEQRNHIDKSATFICTLLKRIRLEDIILKYGI